MRTFHIILSSLMLVSLAFAGDTVLFEVDVSDREIDDDDSVTVTVTALDEEGNTDTDFVGDVEIHEGTDDTPRAILPIGPSDNGTKSASIGFTNPGGVVLHAFAEQGGLLRYGRGSLFVHDTTSADFDGPVSPVDAEDGDEIELEFLDSVTQGAALETRLHVRDSSTSEHDLDYEAAWLITIPDPTDVNGDGITDYQFTSHMVRFNSGGWSLVELVFVMSGGVDVTVENLLNGDTFTETVTVAASATVESGECEVEVSGPSKICKGDTKHVEWATKEGEPKYASTVSVVGDCAKASSKCKADGKKGSTASVTGKKKSGAAG